MLASGALSAYATCTENGINPADSMPLNLSEKWSIPFNWWDTNHWKIKYGQKVRER